MTNKISNITDELPRKRSPMRTKYTSYIDIIKQKVINKVKSQPYLPEMDQVPD